MAMIACRECGSQVSEWAAACPHCGIAGLSGGVAVTDFRMRFGSLVSLLVKVAVAAIPAAIILVAAAAGVVGLFAGLFGR